VCRAWIPASQCRLFHQVTLDFEREDRVSQFLELLASPGRITAFIVKVVVVDFDHLNAAGAYLYSCIMPILRDTAPRFTSIVFRRSTISTELGICLPLDRLTVVSLEGCYGVSHELLALSATMPHLQSLKFDLRNEADAAADSDACCSSHAQ
jgi:hypothetical protein